MNKTVLKIIALSLSMMMLVGCTVENSVDPSEVDAANQPLFVSKDRADKGLFSNEFVGSVSIYNDDGELYFTYAGLIENLFYSDGYVKFDFEGNTYTYINYNIEIIR